MRPGDIAVAYVQEYAEGVGMMRRFWAAAEALDPAVASPAEPDRAALRNLSGTRLPVEAHGRARFIARAWAVRGPAS